MGGGARQRHCKALLGEVKEGGDILDESLQIREGGGRGRSGKWDYRQIGEGNRTKGERGGDRPVYSQTTGVT